MNYLELLRLAVPETIVVITALVVLAADLLTLRELELRLRLTIGALISCVGCVAAIAWMLALPGHANLAEGMLVVDPATQLVKMALLVLAIFTILISIETDFTTHVGEYFALLLFAAVGSRGAEGGQLPQVEFQYRGPMLHAQRDFQARFLCAELGYGEHVRSEGSRDLLAVRGARPAEVAGRKF